MGRKEKLDRSNSKSANDTQESQNIGELSLNNSVSNIK